MGVSLTELVQPQPIEFSDLAHRRIAIDAYNIMYQFLATIRDRFTGEPLRDSQGRVTSHLSGLFYRTTKLLENQIEPVFVFDGTPPLWKRKTMESRSHIRKEAEIKWKQALEKGDIEKVRLYSQAASRLTADMVSDAKELLALMGISCVQAPSEGEAQATHFCRKKQVWAVGSQDWDSLLFGAPRLVRNLSISGRKKLPRKEKYIDVVPELVTLDDVLASLGVTQEQLIMLGILIGTDYNPGGIKGIGPKTALKLVKEKRISDRIFADVHWEFPMTPEQLIDFFMKPPVKDLEIKKEQFHAEKLRAFLVDEHDFSAERIDDTLTKLSGFQKNQKQTGLGKFF